MMNVRALSVWVVVAACTPTAPPGGAGTLPANPTPPPAAPEPAAPSELGLALDHLCTALEQSEHPAPSTQAAPENELTVIERADQAAASLTQHEQDLISALREDGPPIADYAEFVRRAHASGASEFECEALERVISAM